MGAFICKQPNGLYCRFSTVVDCPTHWNMTEEDYIDYRKEAAVKEAERDAREVIERHLHDFEEVIKRFRIANMSQKEFDEVLKEMGHEREPMTDDKKGCKTCTAFECIYQDMEECESDMTSNSLECCDCHCYGHCGNCTEKHYCSGPKCSEE